MQKILLMFTQIKYAKEVNECQISVIALLYMTGEYGSIYVNLCFGITRNERKYMYMHYIVLNNTKIKLFTNIKRIVLNNIVIILGDILN